MSYWPETKENKNKNERKEEKEMDYDSLEKNAWMLAPKVNFFKVKPVFST